MASRPILVTGAAGFAGSHLLDRLGTATPIVGWYRPDASAPAPREGVTWHSVELTDAASVRAALRDSQPAEIYHLAGAPNVETSFANAVPHLEINALGTHHVLHALRDTHNACRVVVVTSAQVYEMGDAPISEDSPLVPASPYGMTKLAQDQLALQAAAADGLDVRVARPFNHAGPRQGPGFAIASFARQVARIEAGFDAPVIRVGNLDTSRDITDVRDVVDGYARIMANGVRGRAYNVCSGRTTPMRALLDHLLHLSRASITVETDPARLRPSDAPVVVGDPTRMRTELGWSAGIPIEQTLLDTLDWWRAEVRSGH